MLLETATSPTPMKQAMTVAWLCGLLALGIAGCGNSGYSTDAPAPTAIVNGIAQALVRN